MELFIVIIIIYGILIWTYFNPEESLLWGKRGMYKEEPQLTESAIRNTKVKALISIIVITLIIIIYIITQILN
ncbi:hypothetical protein M5J14_05315 [Lysinibacillus sp. OL1_EC]|uniref:hypothetical protein n=1 Tax=Lysinibacillus TaxID=400634 RepID=UPI00103E3E25|nr:MULTISPECIES: hypothetical protein [Lysinibacillus]MCM0623941.1 hypothetical protein [Lysinibacillus sp. OL1_EC]MDP1393769.1 hypothetical protein [Lysinibacillus capsici]MDP1414032.1 hypothetical protein [Lysinibacillus capsici]MDP1429921.1 hypothetical protein [Lysinibacillus capsici]TBV88890.1 hypothetical protein EW028_05490 [Lysinibacillus sp. OL1]